MHTSNVLCSRLRGGGKLVSVLADSDMPVDRSAYMHPLRDVSALCVAGAADLLQVARVLHGGPPGRRAMVLYCSCLLDVAAGPAPQHSSQSLPPNRARSLDLDNAHSLLPHSF